MPERAITMMRRMLPPPCGAAPGRTVPASTIGASLQPRNVPRRLSFKRLARSAKRAASGHLQSFGLRQEY
jgi:hypothetical protein